MPPATASAPIATHIVLDPDGRALIEGTNTKVIEVVMDRLAWGWSPEEIHRHHPDLPLAKVYAAFSYYFDHQQELDAEIARLDAIAESMKSAAGESPLKAKARLSRHSK